MCRLLIVEDDTEFQAIMVRRFERRGHRVVGCGCLERARRAAGSDDFDVVLMDRTLGGEDSLSLIEPLRARQPDLHFIMLSGYADPTSIEEARAAGVDQYLTKPCSLGDLEQAIERACELVN
jgi:DNA-binding NtrC family response regulator